MTEHRPQPRRRATRGGIILRIVTLLVFIAGVVLGLLTHTIWLTAIFALGVLIHFLVLIKFARYVEHE